VQMTGFGGQETAYIISPASLASSVKGSFLQGRSSAWWRTRFSVAFTMT